MDKEMRDLIKKDDTGRIYDAAFNTVFNPTKSEQELKDYIAGILDEVYFDRLWKLHFIGFIIERIDRESKRPCLHKEIPQQHYITLENVKKWLCLEKSYYENPQFETLVSLNLLLHNAGSLLLTGCSPAEPVSFSTS